MAVIYWRKSMDRKTFHPAYFDYESKIFEMKKIRPIVNNLWALVALLLASISGNIYFISFENVFQKLEPIGITELQAKTSQHELKIQQIEKILPVVINSLEKVSGRHEAEKEDKLEIISDGAQLRSAPSKESLSLGVLKKGVHILSEGKNGEWYAVKSPKGEEAYLHETLTQKVVR